MFWTKILDLIEKQLSQVTGESLLAPTEYAFTKTAGRHAAEGRMAPGAPPFVRPPHITEAQRGQ